MIIFWAAASILFIAIEAGTVAITSIWFAIGAICALIAAVLGAQLWLQIVWFAVVSVAALIATRPIVKKYVDGRKQATNADRVIGMTVRVCESIDNIAATGAAEADGKVWTARSVNGEPIESGSLAVVKDIQGVKLMVVPAGQEQIQE